MILEKSNELFSFIDQRFSTICLKKWIYKEKILVVDFEYLSLRFAYDVYTKNGEFAIDLVNRQYNTGCKLLKNEKKISLGGGPFEQILFLLDLNIKDLLKRYDARFQYAISIVVPVYNREKLIEKCIDSLNVQTLDRKKFEVIFVDDFSSDNSVEVIQQLIDKDINYRILKRPINSGSASAPRNDGVAASKGKYLFFIDSDDYIFPYALEDMLKSAIDNASDVVYVKYDGDIGRNWGKRPFSKGDVEKAGIVENHLVRSLHCTKLISRDLLRDHNIYFPIDIIIGEDRVYMMQVLSHANKISILGEKRYYYLSNHDQDKLTILPSNLLHDFEVVSRAFKAVYYSNKPKNYKIAFFSSWMNVVLEAYVLAKLRSKRHDVGERKAYFNKLVREFFIYKELHSNMYVYKEFQAAYTAFISKDFDSCIQLTEKKKS